MIPNKYDILAPDAATKLYSGILNAECVRKFSLMSEDSITLCFSLRDAVDFPIGSSTEGFFITKEQTGVWNANTGVWDYKLKFDAYYWLWANKILRYIIPGVDSAKETSFSLTATIDVHASVILNCLAFLGYKFNGSPFRVDTTDTSLSAEAKLIQYNNLSVLGGIQAIAEAFECEWWVDGNAIYFGKCNNKNTNFIFEAGKNVSSIAFSQESKAIPNRVYVFGSERNLPYNYREVNGDDTINGVVNKRLMLPQGVPYLQIEGNIPESEIVEQVIVLDDVYPQTDLTIRESEAYTTKEEQPDGTMLLRTYYKIKYDDDFKFSKSYILPNIELHIIFKSGLLNGMDFGVAFNPIGSNEKNTDGSWNPDAQMFEIIANEDYGRILPDDILRPQKDDKFVIYGWDPTKMEDLGLVSKAEHLLEEKGWKEFNELRKNLSTCTCPMAWDYMKPLLATESHPKLGDNVKIIDTAHFADGYRESRIIGYEYKLDIQYANYTYICGENISSGRLNSLEQKIDSLTKSGEKVRIENGLDFLSKRYSDRTPYELAVGGELIGESNVRSRNFAEGLTGYGYKIDKGGNIYADSLTLRRFLEVPELRYNRTDVIVGNEWNAPGGGVIESVEVISDTTGRVYPKLEDGELMAARAADICMGIWHFGIDTNGDTTDATGDYDDGKGNFYFAGFTTIYFTITSTHTDENGKQYFEYQLREGWSAHPQPSMTWVGYGTFNLNDKIRSRSKYSTRTYTRYLANVHDWEFGEDNIMMQLGDLSGLTVNGEDMSGYSAYLNNVFFSGVIRKIEQTAESPADNLLLGTLGFSSPWQIISGTDTSNKFNGFTVAKYDNSENTSSSSVRVVRYDFDFELGQTYTLSFLTKGSGKLRSYCYSSEYGSLWTKIIATSGTNGGKSTGDTVNDYDLSSQWMRHFVVFLVTKNTKSALTHVLFNAMNGSVVEICGVKLELGDNRSTEWTPAPEEMVGTPGAQGEPGKDGANGKDGINGADAETFEWVVDPPLIPCNGNANLRVSPTDIKVECWHVKGNTREQIPTEIPEGTILLEGRIRVQYREVWSEGETKWQDLPDSGEVTLINDDERDKNPKLHLRVVSGGTKFEEFKILSSEYIVGNTYDGKQGLPGPMGAVTRMRGHWVSGETYNDGTVVENGTRYLDVVWVDSAVGARYYYQCISATGAGSNPPAASSSGGNYNWEAMSDLGSVYTDLICAPNAYIRFLSGQEIVFGETSSTGVYTTWGRIGSPYRNSGMIQPLAGTTPGGGDSEEELDPVIGIYDGLIMWTGAEKPANATFLLDKKGKVTFGGLYKNHIEIDPDVKEINTYDASGKNVVKIDGKVLTLDNMYGTTDNLNYNPNLGTVYESQSYKLNNPGKDYCIKLLAGQSADVSISVDVSMYTQSLAIEARKQGESEAEARWYNKESSVSVELIMEDVVAGDTISGDYNRSQASTALTPDESGSLGDTDSYGVYSKNLKNTVPLTFKAHFKAGSSDRVIKFSLDIRVNKPIEENIVSKTGHIITLQPDAHIVFSKYNAIFKAGNNPRSHYGSNGLTVANSTQDYVRAGMQDGDFLFEASSNFAGLSVRSDGIYAKDSSGKWRKVKFTFE